MDRLSDEMARRAIVDGVPFLMSGPNGMIHAANQAFCELVGYSEVELQRIGWVRLSVDDEDLQADQEMASQLMEGRIQSYQQWKSYKTRYGSPVPGQLLAIRFPPGEVPVEYCLCWFTPLVNGSKAALEMVTEYIKSHSEVTKENSSAIAKMAQAINGHTPKSKFRTMADSMLDWATENPMLFWPILFLALSLNPIPLLQNWATKQGWLPATPVQIQIKDESTGEMKPATQGQLDALDTKYATQIANVEPEEEFEVVTKNGTKVWWSGESPVINFSLGIGRLHRGGERSVGSVGRDRPEHSATGDSPGDTSHSRGEIGRMPWRAGNVF